MEIHLSKTIKNVFVGVCLIAILIVLATLLTPRVTGHSLEQVIGFDSGRAVAVAGARAFYTVDYQEDPGIWAARLCEISTAQGCFFFEKIAAPGLWPGFLKAKTVNTAEVTAVRKAHEEETPDQEETLMQVWEISVELSTPWPQSKSGEKAFPAYAVVLKEPAGWKFERLLMDVEAEMYQGGEQ